MTNFRKLIQKFMISAFMLVSIGAMTFVPVASAATAPYTPAGGALFNNPRGTSQQAHKIIIHVNQMINHSPKGSTIRIASMTLGVQSTTDALISAHKRGANVRILLPSSTRDKPRVKEAMAALGTNKDARSFVAFCQSSCYRDGTVGVMHAKLFMFSQTGTRDKVFTISSSNLDNYQTTRYNDAYTVVSDADAYETSRVYFDRALYDNRNNPPAITTINNRSYYFFPYEDSNVFGNALDHVKCTGVTGGAGSQDGRTVIRMTASLWDYSRIDIARKLVSLKKEDCNIRVVTQSYRLDSRVLKVLQDGNVYVRFADKMNPTYGVHSKYLAITGNYNGVSNANVVLSGSMNLTAYDNAACDNNMIQVRTRSNYEAYLGQFNVLWPRSVPPTSKDVADAPTFTQDSPAADTEVE